MNYNILKILINEQVINNNFYCPLDGVELGNQLQGYNRIVLKEMSSWTALTWHIGMMTAFYTKYIQGKYFRNFIMKI